VRTFVLFIQGGGEGAHKADAVLAKSLQGALGDEYDVRYPQMPDESKPDMQTWKTKIARELEALDSRVMLVGHSMGGATLLKYLSEENVAKPIAGLFLLAVPSWDAENWNFENLKLPSDLAAQVISHTPNLSVSQPRRRDCTVQTSRLTCCQTAARNSPREQ
jgi:uncharacterized protein